MQPPGKNKNSNPSNFLNILEIWRQDISLRSGSDPESEILVSLVVEFSEFYFIQSRFWRTFCFRFTYNLQIDFFVL